MLEGLHFLYAVGTVILCGGSVGAGAVLMLYLIDRWSR